MFGIGIEDIINFIMMFLTLVGLIFTIIELRNNKNLNRANMIKELYIKLYDDIDMMGVFYAIEYDSHPEEEEFDHNLRNTEEGRKVDKLISFFEVICNMYYRKIITKEDLSVFSYEMFRVYKSKKIQLYFKEVNEYQNKEKIGYSYMCYKKYCNESIGETMK